MISEYLKDDINVKNEEKKDGENKLSDLGIWDTNPSFNDIKIKNSIGKAIFLTFLVLFIICSLYLLTFDLKMAIGSGIILLFLFLIVFRDQFFTLKNLLSYTFQKFSSFNPFQKMIFWQEKEEPTIIYFSNRQDLIHIALKIFKIEVLPQTVHAVLDYFNRSLASMDSLTPYTYQIVQTPNIDLYSSSRNLMMMSQTSIRTFIYFNVYFLEKGILWNKKLIHLKGEINRFSSRLKSGFISNFHHFKIASLSSSELINALRMHHVKDNSNFVKKEVEYSYSFERGRSLILTKLLYCSMLVLICDYLLLCFKIGSLMNLVYIILFNMGLVGSIVYLWWREFLFLFAKRFLFNNPKINLISPFKDVSFYRFKQIPDSIFLFINNTLLIDFKMFNLVYAAFPPYGNPDKFFRPILSQQVPFAYTVCNTPMIFYEFYKSGFKHMKEKVRKDFHIEKEQDEINWLNKRSGMWKTILTLSVSSCKLVDSFKTEYIVELEEETRFKARTVQDTFESNFLNYKLVALQKRILISGYLFETLKNKIFRFNGSHLKYLIFQGKILINLTKLIDFLRTGIETRIAAEFNTPTYLPNFISIGNTINMEILEPETSFGFLLDQLKTMLITSGTSNNRELACLKIASELVKTGIPSIIFDFNGTWSRLINYFRDSRFEHDLLYFKLRSAFTIDPLHSDIPYDQNNLTYLEYMFDSYALAFKKSERTIEVFRNTIQRNPGMDLSSLNLELINQREWEKKPMDDALIGLFSDFTQQELTFFRSSEEGSHDQITSLDFITNNKTIIIDLSSSKDYNKQLFISFIILSKIIHYLNSSNDFVPKILFIPHIDLFFDNNYIEQRRNYGIIDKFLKPLIQSKFGLILSANQIRYIHPNVFNYLQNYITFRATDTRDIAVLKNQMNLQELHGMGYYTSSRKNTYQIEYLKNMRENEIIVKRYDIYQPFPAEIDWDKIKGTPKLEEREILRFMGEHGYDVKSTEQQILREAKETLFDKDLGSNVIYLDKIIAFLTDLKTIDQIGNLYETKIIEMLTKYIAPEAKKRQRTNPQIVKLVKNLFSVLIKYGYLVKNHPPQAGGAQTMRPSYKVGDKYNKAIEDYYNVKAEGGVTIDLLEKGTEKPINYENVLQTQNRAYIIGKEDLRGAFAREFSELYWAIFKASSFINKGEYRAALKVQHNLVKRFLMSVYKHFYNVNYIVTYKDLEKFIQDITNDPEIPFTQEEIHDYLERYQILNFDNEDIQSLAIEIYTYYHQFFDKLQLYINKEQNG